MHETQNCFLFGIQMLPELQPFLSALNVKMVKRNQVCDAFEERPAGIEERLFPEDSLVPDPYDMV